jgi:hypothetical protein
MLTRVSARGSVLEAAWGVHFNNILQPPKRSSLQILYTRLAHLFHVHPTPRASHILELTWKLRKNCK